MTHPNPNLGSAKRKSEPIEASFSTLALSLGTQTVIAMGYMDNPATGKRDADMDVARFNIDLLRMLREKTKGNLSDSEQKLLNDMIADLQMKFVQQQQQQNNS